MNSFAPPEAASRRAGALAPWTPDLVDTLFALSSFWFFSQLATGGRTATAACRIIQDLATDAARRALAAKSRG